MFEDLIQQVTMEATETKDEFIFQTISPWIESNYQISISKDELAKAIQLVRMMEIQGINIYNIYEKATVLSDHYKRGYRQGYKDGCDYALEALRNLKKELMEGKDDQN